MYKPTLLVINHAEKCNPGYYLLYLLNITSTYYLNLLSNHDVNQKVGPISYISGVITPQKWHNKRVTVFFHFCKWSNNLTTNW